MNSPWGYRVLILYGMLLATTGVILIFSDSVRSNYGGSGVGIGALGIIFGAVKLRHFGRPSRYPTPTDFDPPR